ncbi:hypothetical protein ABEB36_000664 [Hypothenemus hampei]|uniref:Uncharacterized protein n=1 Tax=Hypothenemus hampei TaxID=57062 RepID=A0ABD1FC01_HYPHA
MSKNSVTTTAMVLLMVIVATTSASPFWFKKFHHKPIILEKEIIPISKSFFPLMHPKMLLTLFFLYGVANAGYFEAAPIAYHAPVVHAAVPVATSYQNTVQISGAPVPVVVKAATPVVAHTIVKSPLLAAPLPYSYH